MRKHLMSWWLSIPDWQTDGLTVKPQPNLSDIKDTDGVFIFEGFKLQKQSDRSFERSFWAKAPWSIYLTECRQLVCYKFYI